jgi:hypothetical protein|tara:strand:- start:434 stop:1276 length:843 start_codon:yes stop_codon:yes gene_type:complete
MPAGPQLDHAVINAKYSMDAAETAFAGLGFQLTERGYHTLGSINHLMILESNYVELIGLPGEEGEEQPGRPDIVDAPLGINGLVFRTEDVAATHAHLEDLGLAAAPPKSFSRPVRLADGTREAKFSTAHVASGVFPGGRVYFCQHHTPDLVWRPEWQRHDNRASTISEFVIASESHASEAETMAKLLGAEVAGSGDHLTVALENAVISLLTPAAYDERFGALASSLDDRGSIFGALVVSCADLTGLKQLLARAGDVPHADHGDRATLRESRFDSVLEFAI